MMAANRSKILTLYKQLLRTSAQFDNYNFRNYAIRRVKDAFREGRLETDAAAAEKLIQKAEQQLQVVKRQTTIGQMYQERGVVLEGLKQKRS